MKSAYLTAGITLGKLLKLLKKNKIDVTPTTIGRMIFLLQGSVWSSIFAAVEKYRFRQQFHATAVPDNPVFIIGHWRTGSTFLHQLLSLDPGLHAPTLFEVALPDSMLISERFYRPVFKAMLGKHRPMDQVKIGINEPQEDEYAWFRMLPGSPLEKIVFPENNHFFLSNELNINPSENQKKGWKKEVRGFFQKLHIRHGKRIIAKNPFNSFRINLLLEIFPNARFIHIVRHPYSVVPSSIHMWRIISEQNTLNRFKNTPTCDEIATTMDKLLKTIEQAELKLPEGTVHTIRYEDLVENPVSEIHRIYETLQLPIYPAFEQTISGFCERLSGYRKNSFNLDDKDKTIIRRRLGWHMDKMNYT